MSSGPNLFARLHKWAIRQDENFLTESFAVVLEQLLILAPEVGVRLVSRLTGGFIELPTGDAGAIDIHTQVETGSGRPDLEISTKDRLAWIEVKAESPLRAGQLEGYRVLLAESGIKHTRLVLLTQYPEVFQADETRPDLEVRWFDVADWLESELPAVEAANEIASFLARQFLDFLRERNMNLTQVGKYMPEGMRALANMLNMLNEAAIACKVPAKRAANWEYIGLRLDGQKYWFGLTYENPDELSFATRCRIDTEAAVRLGEGELGEENWIPGRHRWWRVAELSSESVHFFSRSKVGQLRWLENFLRECLDMARSIETPEQPPIPEELEES
ncbi:MAG TPA: hypothetical protein VMF69_01770 [Gemmataceae bacterium]|nr:hypothetical protein [Gemmataceae bacterium]